MLLWLIKKCGYKDFQCACLTFHPTSLRFDITDSVKFGNKVRKTSGNKLWNSLKRMSKFLKINLKKTTLLLLLWFSLFCAFLFPTQMQSLKLGPFFLTDTFTGKVAHGVNKYQLITFFFLIQRLEFNHRLVGTIYSFSGINNEFRLRANEQVMSSLKGFLINKWFFFSELVCYCITSAGFFKLRASR